MMINRREFIKASSWFIGGTLIVPSIQSCAPQAISFGWVTDIHYALAKVKWDRYFFQSKDKLAEAVLLYNQLNLDFVIETGDFKDENAVPDKQKTLTYLRDIEAVFAKYNGPRYHVLGNHDLDSLSKDEFQSVVLNSGISNAHTYYSYVKKGWRFIVLDACFRSDDVAYANNNFQWYDTAVSQSQLKWLKGELNDSVEPVLIFIHQPLDGVGQLFVNNADEVRSVLEQSGKVMAVFQGHRHEGGYSPINGIHYITQKAMVDFSGMTNSSYSVVAISNEGDINIKGYRRAESRMLMKKELIEV